MCRTSAALRDRRQELVFIGDAMDEGRHSTAVEACLLSEDELAGGPRRGARSRIRSRHGHGPWEEAARVACEGDRRPCSVARSPYRRVRRAGARQPDRRARSTCSSTRRSSATSERAGWRRSGWPRRCMLTIVSLCVFLAYGTTTAVARATGRPRAGGRSARRALARRGNRPTRGGGMLSGWPAPIARLVGGDTPTAALRGALPAPRGVGVAAQSIAIAGQGWLRGREQLGVAMRLVLVAQAVNLIARSGSSTGPAWGWTQRPRHRHRAGGRGGGNRCSSSRGRPRHTGAAWCAHAAVLRRNGWSFGGLLFVRSLALAGSYLVLAGLPRASPTPRSARIRWPTTCSGSVRGARRARDRQRRSSSPGRSALATMRGARSVRTPHVDLGWVRRARGRRAALAGPASSSRSSAATRRRCGRPRPLAVAVLVQGDRRGVVFALDGILIGAEDGSVLALAMVASAAGLGVALMVTGTTTLSGLWLALVAMFLRADRHARRAGAARPAAGRRGAGVAGWPDGVTRGRPYGVEGARRSRRRGGSPRGTRHREGRRATAIRRAGARRADGRGRCGARRSGGVAIDGPRRPRRRRAAASRRAHSP